MALYYVTYEKKGPKDPMQNSLLKSHPICDLLNLDISGKSSSLG